MAKKKIAAAAFAVAVVLVVIAWVAGRRLPERDLDRGATEPAASAGPAGTPSETRPGNLYGRVSTRGGGAVVGWLRFGGDEEAFWGNYFNGRKNDNPWASHVPDERLVERRPLEIFGFEVLRRERRVNLGRPFMARFGDIARIERDGRDLRVTLKSGTVFDLDRFAADDLADGVRVWEDGSSVVDLDEFEMRSIEFLPAPRPGAAAGRLHGTVHTRQGDFTGFLQWDRRACVGADELSGYAPDGKLRMRFDTIRSIARASRDSSLVTLLDGREIVLSGTREVGTGNRGVYVDDLRYGRVLISWDAFERVDFSPGGSGPAYGDFPPGHPLTGSVTTRAGRRLTGRLVYDLDESETTETLDAPFEGVDYTVPFALVASIVSVSREVPGAEYLTVILRSGEELQLERAGDLGESNLGMLVFVDGERPEHVPWTDVAQIEFDRPEATVPPLRDHRGRVRSGS